MVFRKFNNPQKWRVQLIGSRARIFSRRKLIFAHPLWGMLSVPKIGGSHKCLLPVRAQWKQVSRSAGQNKSSVQSVNISNGQLSTELQALFRGLRYISSQSLSLFEFRCRIYYYFHFLQNRDYMSFVYKNNYW